MASLPEELPPSTLSDAASVPVVDLAKVAYDELMAMSASSAANPLRALLPTQPGVLRDRLASISGIFLA